MNDSLGDSLAVETGELFGQMLVLEQQGAAWSGALGVLVVGDGSAGFGTQWACHFRSLSLVGFRFDLEGQFRPEGGIDPIDKYSDSDKF